jgi:GNAT superfamily N-acetyltransferase
LGTVRHSETLEEMALYETLYENKQGRLWVRPKDMFFENVEVDGVSRPRFEKINFAFKNFEFLNENLIQQIAGLYEISFQKPMSRSKLDGTLKLHTKVLCSVAYDGSKMIGYKLGYGRDAGVFYSWLGGVHPDYQKLGVATELMLHQHEWCKIEGFKKVETRTRNEFVSMLRLNLKQGFQIVGTMAANSGSCKILMEKILT